ncbi:hypothetical protein LAZ67_11003539 [Cordylochernes scorpioides]|uniref:RNA-directed DNA polymerase n=1 Tax=Cordylochernes scorpioides TaxID=51811 RepID=A0ABY6L291_9ARAC|nr:hypothetical protein LAZ67_11003539 [Cordylochernes scorpioides]
MSKAKRQAGQKEAELAQENKSVIDALTAMMKSLGRDAPAAAARFDGSSSAESFLRELERSPEFQNSSCDEQSRMVVAALEGEPRRTLQSMDYLYEPYWRIKQVLEDLYPPPETPTHQEFYQLRCGPQGLQEYYLQKVRIGTQLNIDRKEMVNALTQGMPSYSRNLLLIATPSSPSEWLTLARRIYGIGGDPSRPGISSPTESPSPRQSGIQASNSLRRSSQKRPEGSPSTPPTPCKHCQGPHWNNQCPQRSTLLGQRADHPRLSTPPRRTLRKYERNYTITELECLAIIETVDRFKVYLAGNGFTIFTDHCALQWLKNIKNPTGRLFRWSLRLSVYDYQVKYIKGTKQLEADLLSRNPFCGLLDATQLKMYQSELRDNSKYVHQTSGLTTVTRRGVSKIVVPPSLRPTILREAHQKFNHPGISQLTRIISAQYFWSGMSIDIRAFVKNCNICQMSKTPKGPKYGELGELPESPLPFDLVSMDTIAGFARYGSAKNYLHVVVDHATRFAWTFPSRSTSTTTYIQVIKKVLQSGCPKRLLTDRSPAFTSPRFRRFLISHNILPMLTTSNHPQANGLSERLNATLTGKLRLLHLQHPRASWTMLQSKVVKAYNDTAHSVTGFPPSYLMDVSLPKELSHHLDPYPSVTESRRLALQRTKERHKLDKIRFDKNHRSPDFEVGDLVLTKIYQHPNTGKLVPYFSGPYEIIELVEVYGEKCMDIKNVRKWCREFNEGRINVHDEQRSGRPSIPESTVARIDEMVRANRRIILEEIEDGLNEDCSHFSVHKIVSETLGYRKVSTRTPTRTISLKWNVQPPPLQPLHRSEALRLWNRLQRPYHHDHTTRKCLLDGSRSDWSQYCEKCDVFSWGIILWEILTRRIPFNRKSSYQVISTLKRDRDGEFPEIEEALFRWIRQANAMKLAINGNILKEKAILLALKMGQDNFEASNDWLEKFKVRRNIAFKRLHGEAGSVDANSVATWKGFVMDEAMEEVVEEEMNRCFEALKKYQAIDVNYIDFLEVDKDVQVAGEQSIEEIVKETEHSNGFLYTLDYLGRREVLRLLMSYHRFLLSPVTSKILTNSILLRNLKEEIINISPSWNQRPKITCHDDIITKMKVIPTCTMQKEREAAPNHLLS